MVYIDDIVIYSNFELKHEQHLKKVFKLLENANLKLGYDKYDLFCIEITLLIKIYYAHFLALPIIIETLYLNFL